MILRQDPFTKEGDVADAVYPALHLPQVKSGGRQIERTNVPILTGISARFPAPLVASYPCRISTPRGIETVYKRLLNNLPPDGVVQTVTGVKQLNRAGIRHTCLL